MVAFERTADAADLWAETARRHPRERVLNLAAAVIALFENAVARYDDEFLAWLAGLDPRGAHPRSLQHDGGRLRVGTDRGLTEALLVASDGWELASSARPHDVLLATTVAAFAVVTHATSTADEPMLTRIWIWSCGGPVDPVSPFNREARGRLIRFEDDRALAALRRASDLLLHEAHAHPANPIVGLVAAIVGAVEHAIQREDRVALSALREALIERTPAVDVLRARGLPVKGWQRDDLDGDAAVLSSLNASDAWRRAASVPWATRTTRAAAPIIAAIHAAVLKTDVRALGEFTEWAHRYTENDGVLLPTHPRATRATLLVDRLLASLEEHDLRAAERGVPAWWPAYVATATHHIAHLMHECFPDGVDSGSVVPSMRARLEEPREQGRLLHILMQQDADTFVRAVARSALKANAHTASFAENLFTYERVRVQRR